ncbi:unnamed protein product [Ectocarpus sp. 12 AP-2014]
MRVTPEGEKGRGGCAQTPPKDKTHAAAARAAGRASAVEAAEPSAEAPIIPSNTPSSVVAQPDPPDRSRCLDALIVALTNAGDGQGWYTPTTQLQLASLDFCTASRAVPTAHVTVDGDVPSCLEAGIDNGGASRVPAFRPRGVTWNLPIAALRGEDDVFADVRLLVLGHGLGQVGVHFNRWVNGLQLPPALQDLTFGQWYDRPIHKISWPATLRRITFGEAFNQPPRVSSDDRPHRVARLFEAAHNRPSRRHSAPDMARRRRASHVAALVDTAKPSRLKSEVILLVTGLGTASGKHQVQCRHSL